MRILEGNTQPPRRNPGQSQPDPQDPFGQERPPEQLRDWQKNTWFGAAPAAGNPFDEPEDAPELREQRSESLNNHSGVFWNQQSGGYQYTGSVPSAGPAAGKGKNGNGKKKDRKRHPFLTAIAVLTALCAVAAAVHFGILYVREIQITGNNRIAAEEVVRLSGIRKGTPLLSVKSEDAARGIESNPYLVFRYLEKKWPGTVSIRVREREACCWMTWCGIFYTMDKQRVVLFETEEQGIQPSDLVKVNGLKIRSGCMVGQTLMLETTAQQNVFTNLFLEMKVLNCTELIEEADLSNLDSLLLTTRDGFTVAMGDSTNLHAKLRSMLLTRDELIRMGYHGGIINVIMPENPVFTPEE